MSYILDALKKAEAEREQGRVPGLSSQAWSPTAQEVDGGSRPTRPGWPLGLFLVALTGVGIWLWRSAAEAESRPAGGALQPPVVAVSSAPLLVVASVLPIAASAPPLATVAASVAAAPGQPPRPRAAKAHSAASAPPDPERVIKWADMTPTQQQSLAKLTWGGAMHSSDPSARMVIINDQVVREGEALGPGIVLERIEPKSVVIKLQGQLIRKNF